MTDNKSIQEKLFAEFTKNYMEKLFYFCLKKTGNSFEAEGLAQDIALNIFTALNGGTIPTSFSAWVWQIARNRYSVWADKKHRHSELVAGFDIGDCEIEDENRNILDEMIHSEQLSLLRRELAFIKSDYRNIVIAYYIDDRSVRDIAESLSLTESIVKQRLHRARKILKEGMNMAREFGKLSYKPENIYFICNGLFGSDGEPWNYLSRSLCKNIMLAAYRSPSTAEELAVEVGVALPYMEEELESLVEATLMKKNGNKYETNFFIVSAEAQEKIFAHLRGITPELTKAVIDALEFEVVWKNESCPGWHEGYQRYEDMKWALLMSETDTISFYTLKPFYQNEEDVPEIGSWGHTIRPNGGEWDILGMEIYHGEMPAFVGLHGCISSPKERELPEIEFRQYKFKYCKIEEQTPNMLSYAEGQALEWLVKGKGDKANPKLLKNLEEYGYIRKTVEGYEPALLVMCKEKQGKMPKEIRENLEKLRYKARDIATRHYLFCREQIYKEIPEFLRDDEYQIDHACRNIFDMRGAILEEAIRQGYLYYNKDDAKRILGAYITV